MSYRHSMLALLFALVALLAPSLAAGYGALAAAPAPAVCAVDDGVEVPVFKPCEKQGGKRLLPCHPDLGVLAAMPAAPIWRPASVLQPTAGPMRRLLAPSADPPPPRRA